MDLKNEIPNRDDLMKMKFNFENLIPILQKVFDYLDQFSNGDLIIGIGNTGCGKSTMFNSLMFGSQCLQEV